jgi:hypothetical protein
MGISDPEEAAIAVGAEELTNELSIDWMNPSWM